MNSYYLPAEWAPQEALQLTWPHAATDWRPYLAAIDEVYLNMACAVASRQRLIIVTPEPQRIDALLRQRLTNEQQQQVTLHNCTTDDTWARDHAFLTLLPTDGTTQERLLLDFRFNGWGEKFAADNDNRINRSLATILSGRRIDYDDFVLEGGSVESDGKGTIFTTSCCLLAPNRNQPMTRQDLERTLCQRLGAQRLLWIDHGHLDGDDTDGHIDTLVRTAPNDTLLYVHCDDTADSHYADLLLMRQQLATFRTLDNRPYRLIPLPMPEPIYHNPNNGQQAMINEYNNKQQLERLPATYANFVIINGAVIYPTYNQPHNDALAADALRQAFPNRELIPIDSRTVILQHGSLHCCTMQYPK